MSSRTILALGATGNQGGGLVRALAKINEASEASVAPYRILAHSRSASSSAARELTKLRGVEIVEGTYDTLPSLFERHAPIYGVFNSQPPMMENEVQEACKVIDLAVAHGVKHMVYTSVDFGGQEDTGLVLWEIKRQVENYLRKHTDMQWTMLRPTSFMTNLADYESERGKIAMTANLDLTFAADAPKSLRWQFIAPSDIGHFGALAFEKPAEYAGKAIALAGDEVNPAEIEKAFLDNGIKLEHGGPELTVKAEAALAGSEIYRKMHQWFGTPGPDGRGPYKADIETLRRIHPGLKTLKDWIATELLPMKQKSA